jgi:hypothetical protein
MFLAALSDAAKTGEFEDVCTFLSPATAGSS